jgi:DNA-binding NarL/FixJ family response regulator
MARLCCLAAVAPEDLPVLTVALNAAFAHADASIAELDVAVLRALAPDVLVIDIDRVDVDPIEAIRQLRFVLPECVIVVYTGGTNSEVVRACHNAGANCLLSKSSDGSQLATGLRRAMWSGCFTDPRFVSSF